MGKAHLVVRAEVPDPADWAAFDHWYATDYLPWAMRYEGLCEDKPAAGVRRPVPHSSR